MPMIIDFGVSYSEFWTMTIGEIRKIKEYADKKETERIDAETKITACNAYWTACLSRAKRFPESVVKAFPEIFGRTRSGGVSVQNWREGKAEMAKIRDYMRQRKAVDK
jgi:hypothetical protein